MIIFKRIIIDTYKAVTNVTLEPLPGIIKVTGQNLDDAYESNGASKSTVLQALVFALYNRDYNGAPLDSLRNRTTGREPKVSVYLMDTMTNQEYLVVNDKQTKSHTVTTISTGVATTSSKATLDKISEILGMSYNTFKLTHFITGNTISSITESLSQPVIFNDLLQVVEYQSLEKLIVSSINEVQSETAELEKKHHELTRNRKLAEAQDKYDSQYLVAALETQQGDLSLLESKHQVIYDALYPEIQTQQNYVVHTKKSLSDTQSSLSSGICKACGTSLVTADTISVLKAYERKLQEQLQESSELLEMLKDKLSVATKAYQIQKAQLTESINSLNGDLKIARELLSISGESLVYDAQHIASLEAKISESRNVISYLQKARQEIKNGNVIKELLNAFFIEVQTKIQEYAAVLNLQAFSISLSADNLGMQIDITQTIKNKQVAVPVETLSNGEKTRLSLLILVAMLDAMKAVSNCETNYLVFDEASSSFDKSGVAELAMLFAHLKHLGQSCYIITHGNEMKDVMFDYELVATKHNGTSSVSITEL